MFNLHLLNVLFWSLFHSTGYFFATINKNDQERRLIRGKWIYQYLLRMGPLYIKMGQILATRTDLIDDEMSSQLRKLQDSAPPSTEKYIKEVINKELSQPIAEIFEEFSFQPVASASIAQVHMAVLKTGQKVAVKIVKKNVKKQLEENLRFFQFIIVSLHSLLPSVKHLNLPEVFKELYALLSPQTDFKQEAERQLAIYANFKDHPYVIIPNLIPELCTSSVLVMEFMEGIRSQDVRQVQIPLSQLALRLQETVSTMIYFHGLCHGDPHPGNILFTKNGKIILLDFGITVQLSEGEKWSLSSFYYACIRKEWNLAVKRFTEYFVTHKDKALKEWTFYEHEIANLLKLHFDIYKQQWSTITYYQDINKVLKKYDARFTTNFTKIQLAVVSSEGFLTQIDPKIDVWANARKFTDRFSPYINSAVKATFDQYFSQFSPGSLELRDRAHVSLVAPTHIDRYFFPSTYPLFVKKAAGSKIEDVDSNIYVDLSCGYGPHILGYAHPAITTALNEVIQLGGVNVIGNLPEVQLAETLVDALPGSEKAIFSNSGTEAIMHAVRLCRAYRKYDTVAKFEGQYHGFSDLGLVSSMFRFKGSKERPEPIEGTQGCHKDIVEDTLVLQYSHPGSLERIYESRDRLACVICEPMPSAMAAYDKTFLQELRNLCTSLDIPLIFDEVVTGFRVTYGGVQNLIDVVPDLTCLGKIIGGGLPCGCVVGKQELINIAKSSEDPFLDYERKAFVGGTMSGNSLSCTAGLACLTYLKEHPEIYTRLEQQTNLLAQELIKIAKSYNIPTQIKANRSIFSISFSYKNATIIREKTIGSNFKASLALSYYMRKYGVYMPELHILMLNAAHSQEDLDTVCSAFNNSLKEMVKDGFFVVAS